MEKKPLDQSYNRYCVYCCVNRLHRSYSGLICADCWTTWQKLPLVEQQKIVAGVEIIKGNDMNEESVEVTPRHGGCEIPLGTLQQGIKQFVEGLDSPPQEESRPIQQFTTGALRGSSELPFHLIHPQALMGIAMASGEGSQKYGAYNNLKGFPFSNLYNHAMAHLLLFWWRDNSEDHLGHALWNLSQLKMQWEENGYSDTFTKLDDRPKTDIHVIESLKAHQDHLKKIIELLTK